MKAIVLAVSAAALAATLPASASIVTVGNSLARGCYLAAEGRRIGPDYVAICDRAITEGALDYRDRFATHVNRGILRMLKRDYQRAQEDFNAAVAMYPDHPEPWLNMGIMQYNRGDSRAAVANFDKALRLGTRAPEIAYFGRGLANEEAGNIKAAYADLNRAASIKPDWGEPMAELQRYQVRR